MVYAVIMAGGFGTRFWPKSRKSTPKQFLNLFGQTTMIQQTVERLKGFIDPEQVVVVTNQDYVELVKKQLPSVKSSSIIGEPVGRNTAPCIASAATLLHKSDPDSVMVVLPADHRIGNPESFRKALQTAVKTAEKEKSLVTIGIKPGRPETGYGYIKRNENPDSTEAALPVYQVQQFTEKPDLDTAMKFYESDQYLWNSGIFIWKTDVILDAFKKHLPDLYHSAKKLEQSEFLEEDIEMFYHSCPSVSIDYGIMEKADKVHVVPGDFDWNDVGSWRAVYDLSDRDAHGNASVQTETLFINSSGNYVSAKGKKLVALAGVDNIAFVETEDAILLVNLERAQDVKKVVEELNSNEETKKYL